LPLLLLSYFSWLSFSTLTTGDTASEARSMGGHTDRQHVPLPEDQELNGGDGGPALNPAAHAYMPGPPPAEIWTALIQQLAQQQQPCNQQQPRPEKVRLPLQHVLRPKTWFTLAESNFEQQHVTDSRTKFNLILLELNDEQVRRVAVITVVVYSISATFETVVYYMSLCLASLSNKEKISLLEPIFRGVFLHFVVSIKKLKP